MHDHKMHIVIYATLRWCHLVQQSVSFWNSCYADWTRLWSLIHGKCCCEWCLHNIKLVFVLNHSLGSFLLILTVFVLLFIASSSRKSKLYPFTRNLVVPSVLGLRVWISRSGHLSLWFLQMPQDWRNMLFNFQQIAAREKKRPKTIKHRDNDNPNHEEN